MILEQYKRLQKPSQLMMSFQLDEVTGFRLLITTLVVNAKETMNNLNPDDSGFNLRYRTLQHHIREYEGLIEILDNRG